MLPAGVQACADSPYRGFAGRLEDIRAKTAQNEKSRTKYFYLQALELQKSSQKILRSEGANALSPE